MTERLSADDWIRAGLKALAAQGFTALKAEVLAKSLGVSRGSFYWHFANLEAFHIQVMQRWLGLSAAAIIREVESAGAGADRLSRLIRIAFEAGPSLEIGMRAWANAHERARPFVAAVDKQRLDYLMQVLTDVGATPVQARVHARIIYWTYLGATLSRQRVSGPDLERLIETLAMPSPEKSRPASAARDDENPASPSRSPP